MHPIALPSRLQPVDRAVVAKFTSSKEVSSRGVQEVVYLIDEAVGFRESLMALLRSRGLEAVGFSSAGEYFKYPRRDGAACLIVDFHLRDMCSFALLRKLKDQGGPPVIFISGSPDVPNTVSAMSAGAMEFFEKPVDLDSLLVAIRLAFEQHRKIRQKNAELARLKGQLSLLTPREREVLPLVVGGVLNQRAAAVLGISKVTLQIHRSQVMRKMGADSVADLVRMAVKLRIPHRCAGQMAQARAEEEQQRRGSGLVAL
ncbi:FixJ family two-component response regulator [Granulicella aggregans]|uniref:FixJ family two-component response regulator n=1 Tax=Granulicella aggregans TaxID=474949 RepID=A0A7W8E672_9BACT|nr:LuxR C-terminal-related transcriptional regulator [Granulicella aggregans]MBB5060903.1 FixJ family two-component response regulator [Granulicella aggregans]